MEYTYNVIWSGEDDEFVGLCDNFPGLSWLDSDPKRALMGIKLLVKVIAEDIKNDNGECQNCECGTLERTFEDELVCRGECGEITKVK